jgi:hypothetical protein
MLKQMVHKVSEIITVILKVKKNRDLISLGKEKLVE